MELRARDFVIVGRDDEINNRIKTVDRNLWMHQEVMPPFIAATILGLIVLGCILANVITYREPSFMDYAHTNVSPNYDFAMGTDSMGRDIAAMVWFGGRVSLFIGVVSTLISTSLGILYGTISGLSHRWLDEIMMRITDILLSIPSILMLLFLQGLVGCDTPLRMAILIGITRWVPISKIVRTEVIHLKNSDFVVASRGLGGGFFHILIKHLFPNFIWSIMFMIVTDVGTAIGLESTLSFLGLGLPLEVISWGSMLSLAETAILSNHWWIIVIPGIFLISTLVCITDIGNYIRKINHAKFNHL